MIGSLSIFYRLQTHFGLTADKANVTVSNLKMIRPYGSVGLFRWQGGTVPFGARTGTKQLLSLSESVRTFTEQNLSAALRSEIAQALNAAGWSCF